MDAGSIERLELRNGEPVNAAHVVALDRAITKNASLPGVHVRRRVFPWGTCHSYHASGSGGLASAPAFEPDVTIVDSQTAEVRWNGPRALINGVAPRIDGHEIFTEDEETGARPALTVGRDAFNAAGECGVYFRCEVDPQNFGIFKITPVALPPPPATEKLVAHKLALHLRLRAGAMSYDEDDDRELFSSLGFYAVSRRATGVFTALWWMV